MLETVSGLLTVSPGAMLATENSAVVGVRPSTSVPVVNELAPRSSLSVNSAPVVRLPSVTSESPATAIDASSRRRRLRSSGSVGAPSSSRR